MPAPHDPQTADHPASLEMTDPKPEWSIAVIVLVDVVESVRLMQQDEAGVIFRWRRFLTEVQQQVLPRRLGRLVKSLGDGMLLEFPDVPAAVSAAHELHQLIQRANSPLQPEQALWLRVGVHVAKVIRDSLDLFGSGVNLGARIAAAAQPGEVLVSVEARAQLVQGLDGELHDMGECFLKHVEGTHRLFRVMSPGAAPRLRAHSPTSVLRPTIAVAPMQAAYDAVLAPGLPAALVDDLVSALSRLPQFQVVSRLSTAALGNRVLDPSDLAALLGVQYLVQSRLYRVGEQLEVRTHVFESASSQVVWQGVHRAPMAALLGAHDPLPVSLTRDISEALLKRQVDLAHEAALPTLAGYTMLLSAIAALHSLGRADMLQSRAMLEHLTERYPRAHDARVWLAKWHFLQIAQVSSADSGEAVRRTRALLAQVLDEAPDQALALALSGHMAAYVDADLVQAEQKLTQAVEVGPNESLSSLFLAQLYVNTGRAEAAVQAVEQATALSPLDPLGYYYDLFAASAYSAAGHHERALVLAQRSVRQNALHLSSWVQLIIAQVLVGKLEDALTSAARYRVLRPTASVKRFLQHHAAPDSPLARRNAEALLRAGLPW